MILYLCPKIDVMSPSGGIWYIHRLAQMANDHIQPSKVVQTDGPMPVWWDSRPIRPELVITHEEVNDEPDFPENITWIVPEVMWLDYLPLLKQAKRRIMFVQNHIWAPKQIADYQNVEVLVCSRYLANYMRRVYFANVLGKVTPYLDDELWHVAPKQANRTLIFARRNKYHEAMKLALEAEGFPVEYVTEPLTQVQISEKLADCEFYVHLNHPEGWPMACVEAMRMGTIVCGTTGGGGNEFMFDLQTAMVVQDPENGHYHDPLEFVNRIMEKMRILRGDAALREKIWKQAYEWSKRYTAEATLEELKQVLS